MGIQVNPELCEANGRCVTALPEVFSLDDDDILHIGTPGPEVGPEQITRAVAACPLTALSWTEGTGSAVTLE
jgi:ferredoxin